MVCAYLSLLPGSTVHDLSKIVDNGNDYIIRTLVDSLKRLAAPKLD